MIVVSREILEAIKAQARAEIPNEACGYLAGDRLADGETRVAAIRIPMTNIDASPEHFSFDAKEQFAALKQAREAGLRLIATYHSHPETPARMSDEDIRLANDPDTVYLIYSLATDDIKGFTIDREKTVGTYPVEVRG
jgi:proteasome lid subunit RPN8/RPN11